MKYLKVKMPEHPRADITGNVPVHIIVAEKKLGRPLKKGELVHHCDFDKHNNEPENLLALSRKEHQQLPEIQARFLFQQNMYPEFLKFWQKEKVIVHTEHEITKVKHNLERLRKKHAKKTK